MPASIEPNGARRGASGEALPSRMPASIEPNGARRGVCEERIRPAEPTLDEAQLIDLVRLRLESLALPSGVIRIEVAAASAPATQEQLRLLSQKPRRDPRAAARAIARIRASLGADAVVRARLREGHLPEARYAWEPVDGLTPAKPRDSTSISPCLVRRIEPRPVPLPPRPAREPDGWLLAGLAHGPVERVSGPYRISGGWWRAEVERDYYFAELASGALFWVYFDRRRRRWFLHGRFA
jgi:protein ImuB